MPHKAPIAWFIDGTGVHSSTKAWRSAWRPHISTLRNLIGLLLCRRQCLQDRVAVKVILAEVSDSTWLALGAVHSCFWDVLIVLPCRYLLFAVASAPAPIVHCMSLVALC